MKGNGILSRRHRQLPLAMRSIASLFFLFNINPASAECTVGIGGGSPIMNVGQKADFAATVTGGGTPVSYQWSVSGDILKDYQESTQFPWSTTPMAPADFQGPNLSFYWKPDASQKHPQNGGAVNRAVSVEVLAGADVCSAQAVIGVERNNTDITRQAEDFYLANHPELDGAVIRGRALKEHRLWHKSVGFGTPGYGSLFFDFHLAYIGRFDAWRQAFGYPATITWNTGMAIPTGVEIDHPGRKASYLLTPKPTWFTIAGGTGVRSSNGKSCDPGGGQNDLFDFLERPHLGCAASSPYHGNIHSRVGGAMGNVSISPVDPLFWRWHLFLDRVSQEWLAGPPVPVATTGEPSLIARLMRVLITPVAADQPRKSLDIRPPEIIYQAPFRLFRYITSLRSVAVTFSEPVTGVKPSDLSVNGSAAIEVTGEQAGPYAFSGYAPPTRPQVKVEIRGGGIQDLSGNAFAGNAWGYRLVKRGADSDGDGIKDGAEANEYRTDPLHADSDRDGLRDDFEIAHACLDPLTNEAHPHDMEENPIPGDTDADDDGLSDLEELAHGTNPCAAS